MTSSWRAKHSATREAFAQNLHSIWQRGGRKARLGLAISGGVDSMALGRLCQQANEHGSAVADTLSKLSGSAFRASFTAFIVNHKLRPGSTEEARSVSSELSKLGIESDILDLDWTRHGRPSAMKNVESIARRLRYQAIARACRERQINTLLVAHHRDDQAETVLMRLLANYAGFGLRGMKAEAAIPECAGIYGVDHSGHGELNSRNEGTSNFERYMDTESGGIRIARPLLHIDKAQLVELCTRDGVGWFEDPTNADPTMTLRNSVRWLLENDDLPRALRKERLLAIAAEKADEEAGLERAASEVFDRTSATLETRSGKARFEMPQEVSGLQPTVHAMLLRKMMATVTPKPKLSLQEIASRASHILKPIDNPTGGRSAAVNRIQLAGVEIRANQRESSAVEIAINRAVPTSREKETLRTRLWSREDSSSLTRDGVDWPHWQLWDGRYWIRVLAPSAGDSARSTTIVCTRFLEKEDLAILRKSFSPEELEELQAALAGATGAKRFTCPVIVAKQEDESGGKMEQVVALPSLGWSRNGWVRENCPTDANCWRWDIRFRHVDMGTHSRNDIV